MSKFRRSEEVHRAVTLDAERNERMGVIVNMDGSYRAFMASQIRWVAGQQEAVMRGFWGDDVARTVEQTILLTNLPRDLREALNPPESAK